MWFSADGCTGWHFIKHHFSARLPASLVLQTYCLSHQEEQVLKVRTEQVPLCRKWSRWPIYDGLPLLDERLIQSQTDQLPIKRGLGWGNLYFPVTDNRLNHFLRLCPLSISITDLSRNEVPYDQFCAIFHWYLLMNVWILPKLLTSVLGYILFSHPF